jgi:glycosyltransferase involved in cell wall biosynthesis
MVTGAYHPETSGASLQCRQLVRLLRDEVGFTVLTTTTDFALPPQAVVDDVDVWRVQVDPARAASKIAAIPGLGAAFGRLRDCFDLVHLHGFSQKTMLLIALAKTFGKRVLIKLTSVGHDDAVSMQRRGRVAFGFYRSADRFVGVSPRFEAAHRDAGLAADRFRLIPNGVDLERFRPAQPGEQRSIRERLGLPTDVPIVLFVGFFSPEKRPDLLYESWTELATMGVTSTLVLIGPTRSTYYEIDPQMAEAIRADANRRGLSSQIVFVEQTAEIEQYYRAADVFALPTLREGLPNVVLESMASGVPTIVTRLAEVTDWMIDDGVTGLLVPPNDRAALTGALQRLLSDSRKREIMGPAARASVTERFDAAGTAKQMLALYRELI